MCRLFLVTLAAASLVGSSAHALWQPGGNPVCLAPGYQSRLDMVPDGTGGVIVVWSDTRSGEADLYAQRIDQDGNPLWAIDGVPVCVAGEDQLFPRLVADGAGGAIAVWWDRRSPDTGIYAQRIDGAGSRLWAPDGVSVDPSSGSDTAPRLLEDGAGGAFVLWERIGFVLDIHAQRIGPDGTLLWSPGPIVICDASDIQQDPSAALDGSGGFIVAWEDVRNRPEIQIFGQRIAGDGAALWEANGRMLVASASGQAHSPRVIPDGQGNVLLAWRDWRTGASGIYVQKLDGNAAPQWTEGEIQLAAFSHSDEAFAAMPDGAGGLIAAWHQNYPSDVYAQRMSGQGALLWGPGAVVVSAALRDQRLPGLARDGVGGAFIAWSDTRNVCTDIYSQKIRHDGLPLWVADGVETAVFDRTQGGFRLSPHPQGGVYVAWEDQRSSEVQDLYIHRITSQGSGLTGECENPVTGVPLGTSPSLALHASPNPFTTTTTIRYHLSAETCVRLDLHDVRGRLVRSLVDEVLPAGQHSVACAVAPPEGSALPAGLYFVRLSAGESVETARITLLR